MNENVKFVPKRFNPLNVSQTCPIENFWRCLAQKARILIRRIKSKMKEFDKNFVESLLEGVKAKVKSIGDNGAYFSFK